MNARSRTRNWRRIAAAVVLPLLILAFASPLAPHEQSAADCHPNAPAGIALSQGDSSPQCDHNADTACATMLGCVVLPSAVTSVASRFSAQATVAVAATFGSRVLHGRLGLGPPTPPPNS